MSTSRTTDEQTNYRDLTLPAFEKDPWIGDWDDVMEIADEELVPQLTTTERDNTTPHTNALCYNITENRFERYDGSAWVPARAEAISGVTATDAYFHGGLGL